VGGRDNFWYCCLFQTGPKERDNDVTRMKKTLSTTFETHIPTASLASNKLEMNGNNVRKIFYPQNTGLVILVLERAIPLNDFANIVPIILSVSVSNT
jgi:hypothetical protein